MHLLGMIRIVVDSYNVMQLNKLERIISLNFLLFCVHWFDIGNILVHDQPVIILYLSVLFISLGNFWVINAVALSFGDDGLELIVSLVIANAFDQALLLILFQINNIELHYLPAVSAYDGLKFLLHFAFEIKVFEFFVTYFEIMIFLHIVVMKIHRYVTNLYLGAKYLLHILNGCFIW